MRKYLPLMTLAVLIAVSANATPIVPVPPGLAVGDTYRLVFVTFDTTDATSTSIATYNTFVTTEADASAALFGFGRHLDRDRFHRHHQRHRQYRHARRFGL